MWIIFMYAAFLHNAEVIDSRKINSLVPDGKSFNIYCKLRWDNIYRKIYKFHSVNTRVTFESGWSLDGNVPWNVIRKKQCCAWQQQITENNVAKESFVHLHLTTSYTLIIMFPSERKFLPQTLPDHTNHLRCTSFCAELSFCKQQNATAMDWWWVDQIK